jgi:hypothetical protein
MEISFPGKLFCGQGPSQLVLSCSLRNQFARPVCPSKCSRDAAPFQKEPFLNAAAFRKGFFQSCFLTEFHACGILRTEQ